MIYIPEQQWMYSHHPYITWYRGRYVAAWSNGMKDEDNPGQRVAFSTSLNFREWTTPQVLAAPSVYCGDTLNILTAVGFHTFNDTLIAYYGEYSPHKQHTRLWAKTSADGLKWSEAIDMDIPVNANIGPQRLANGRLIISGNFTFPYSDDPQGLSGWEMSSIYPAGWYKEDNPATFYAPAEKAGYPPLCEGAFYQTDDNVIHMLMRVTGKGWKGKLWQTESRDNGKSWTAPIESGFPDNDSKFHFGRLPDKRFYYVGIPDTLNHYARCPLVISVSTDGKNFAKHFIIADELYKLKKEGLWKGGQYGYPLTFIRDNYMYVIVSRQKEAIEILRFDVRQLN